MPWRQAGQSKTAEEAQYPAQFCIEIATLFSKKAAQPQLEDTGGRSTSSFSTPTAEQTIPAAAAMAAAKAPAKPDYGKATAGQQPMGRPIGAPCRGVQGRQVSSVH